MAYDAKDPLLLATVRRLFESEEVFKGLSPEMFDLIIARATRQAVDRMAGGVGAGFEPGDGYEWVRKRYRVDPQVGQRVHHPDSGRMGTVLPVAAGSHHYVRFVIDGFSYVSLEHPRSLDYQEQFVDARSDLRLLAALASECVPEPEHFHQAAALEAEYQAEHDPAMAPAFGR